MLIVVDRRRGRRKAAASGGRVRAKRCRGGCDVTMGGAVAVRGGGFRTVDTADSGDTVQREKTYDLRGGSIVALIGMREQSAGHGPRPLTLSPAPRQRAKMVDEEAPSRESACTVSGCAPKVGCKHSMSRFAPCTIFPAQPPSIQLRQHALSPGDISA